MKEIENKLKELYNRIPRRHNPDNVKEIYNIIDELEDVLKTLEADAEQEKEVAHFFDALEPIRTTIKKSNDNKASKTKDQLFDEASGDLKDTIEELMQRQ